MAAHTYDYRYLICRLDGMVICDSLPIDDFSQAKREAKQHTMRVHGGFGDVRVYVYKRYNGQTIEIWELNGATGRFIKA